MKKKISRLKINFIKAGKVQFKTKAINCCLLLAPSVKLSLAIKSLFPVMRIMKIFLTLFSAVLKKRGEIGPFRGS